MPLHFAAPMAIFDLVQAHDGSLFLVGNGGIIRIPLQDLKPI
jgi:hypothetical protein